MTGRRIRSSILAVCVAATALLGSGAPPAAADPLVPQAADVGFESLTPARLLDTRPTNAIGAGGVIELSVLGRGGVPATGVESVVLNITVNQPTAVGYLTVWPTGSAQPNASNLNFTPGTTVANLVVAKVGTGGRVSIFNSAGSTHVLADVVGYANAGGLTSLVPARVLDTRAGGATIDGLAAREGGFGTNAERLLPVLGRGGVPASGVDAVILNVTVNQPTAVGYLTVWPNGEARPNASNVNFEPGSTVPNLVVAKVGAGGAVGIYNSLGTTDVIADVVGYFTTSAAFAGLSPARLLDTRPGTATIDGVAAGVGAIGTSPVSLRVTGRGGVPSSGVGTVFLNVTVTNPTAVGYLTVWPSGVARPEASNLNFVPRQTVANLVAARVGADGRVAFFNSAGTTDLIVDVVGWIPPTDTLSHDTFELQPGMVGAPYSFANASRGGDAPYSWNAAPLQPGLAISPTTGVVSGTPTTAGTISTTVGIGDAFGRSSSRQVGHTIFPAGSGFAPVTPATVLNVSDFPATTTNFPVVGTAGVPADAEAVVLMVFSASFNSGFTQLYPAGSPAPLFPSTVYPVGLDTNLVVVAPGAGGQVTLQNTGGPTLGIVVEVMGYFAAGSAYTPISGVRVLDTRSGSPVAAGATRSASTTLPGGATAALVSITTVNPSAGGSLTAWSGPTAPANPAVRWAAASGTTTRFVLVPLVDGTVTVRPDGATTHILVDVLAYIA